MAWDVYTTTTPIARKDYACDAATHLSDIAVDEFDFTDKERRLMDQVHAGELKINKGEKYIKTSGLWDGESSVFRARPDLEKICVKYGIYELYGY